MDIPLISYSLYIIQKELFRSTRTELRNFHIYLCNCINSAFHKQPFQTISENIPETSQTSKMKLIAKKVNCYQPFAFSAKSFILAFIDVQF